MDTTSEHYKGKFTNIYAVHKKYPNGGAAGDFVDIGGWAHYWNEDRGTWCVNENRDNYWDEKFSDIENEIETLQENIDKHKVLSVKSNETVSTYTLSDYSMICVIGVGTLEGKLLAVILPNSGTTTKGYLYQFKAEWRVVTAAIEYNESVKFSNLITSFEINSEALTSFVKLTAGDNITIEDGVISATGGMTDEQAAQLEKLMDKNYPLSVTASISPTALQEKGKVLFQATISAIKAVVDGTEQTKTKVTVNDTELTEDTFTDSSITDTKNYEIKVWIADGRSASITKSVIFVYPIYIFFSTESDYTKVALSGKQSLATSLNYTNKVVNNGTGVQAYLWIVTPYAPTKVQSTTGLTIDIAGASKGVLDNHYYWRSDDPLETGDWTLNIK